jgi:hypothetical protein
MFIVGSNDGWRDPVLSRRALAGASPALPNGYYRSEDSRQRHRQALSYLHGAEEATAHNRFALAARLHRKAAIAWSLCDWGERGADDAEDPWTAERLREQYGERWLWAARSYFRAKLLSIGSDKFDEKNERLVSYAPADVWWSDSGTRAAPDATPPEIFDTRSDIERMSFCWDQCVEAKKLASSERAKQLEHELTVRTEHARQLGTIQNELARAGLRTDAIEVHRDRRKLEARCLRIDARTKKPVAAALCWARSIGAEWMRLISQNGSDVWRMVAVIATIYLVVFPLLYWKLGLIVHAHSGAGAGFLGSEAVSWASVAGLSVRDYAAADTSAACLQAAQSVLAFFFLGYLIWMFTRSYDDA